MKMAVRAPVHALVRPRRGRVVRPKRLLQECHLAGVIQMVLRHANELGVGRVGRLGHQPLVETFPRKAPYRLSEIVVELFQHTDRIPPVLGTRLWD
ncbi:MAG: hypothetical protein ACREBG_31060, partial [Pyrinomonadaceae bacterium]